MANGVVTKVIQSLSFLAKKVQMSPEPGRPARTMNQCHSSFNTDRRDINHYQAVHSGLSQKLTMVKVIDYTKACSDK